MRTTADFFRGDGEIDVCNSEFQKYVINYSVYRRFVTLLYLYLKLFIFPDSFLQLFYIN